MQRSSPPPYRDSSGLAGIVLSAGVVLAGAVLSAGVVLSACESSPENMPAPRLEPSDQLPSAAPGALGPLLPTARTASPRIPVAPPASSARLDAGSSSAGDGVPL